VSIDLLPGEGAGSLPTSTNPANAPIIEGAVAPDPSNALAAATEAFQNVKGTLQSIDQAAKGIAAMTDKTKNLDEFLTSFRDMGRKVGNLADELDKTMKASSGDFPATLASIRQASDKFNATFDEETRANLQASARQLNASSAKLDKVLADFQPVARDLAADPTKVPTTNLGQVLLRFNRISYDVGLLTGQLATPNGKLNPNGSLQKMVMSDELYENWNRMAISARDVMGGAKTVLANFNRFAERIANDPGAISRGALKRD
jgi:phospholipid/cholesterol/gamma-HCH transport system substrate-binding protein